MSGRLSTIVYTYTDEAPALATHSLLPILKAFAAPAGVSFSLRDISLTGRILATFPDKGRSEQAQSDDLAILGQMAKTAEANIVKLPNISASIPQLKAAIKELQQNGYQVPDYPEHPKSDEARAVKQRYAKVLGSAVNPVLREGNSDRRVAAPVKAFAQKHPHKLRAWSADSPSHVAHMQEGDFYQNEQSMVCEQACSVRIELKRDSGETTVLRPDLKLETGEIFDGSFMSCDALRSFFEAQLLDAQEQGLLLSLHLKATMMKVSDPIIFGHAVSVYLAPLFKQFGEKLKALGVDPRNGIGDLLSKIEALPADEKAEIEEQVALCYSRGPALAMVDSDNGITNLHVPSDVIIDASMPVVVRDGGTMWGPDGKPASTKAMIPDRSYAGVYRTLVENCKRNGAFDVATMGNVCNVGLMAKKAEEYGSHDKTFEMPEAGVVRVVDHESDTVLMEHRVGKGDIWRGCQTKDVAVRDWVKLGVRRARETGAMAIFWLDQARAHDATLIGLVKRYLTDHDTSGPDIRIMAPPEATELTCQRCREGLDTVSVTGNVLRDYLTDLFPILELGTSAKMLSIVPLLAGGGLFETGAGGSAPKHVQQLVAENHLRWDSLGEFLALGASFEHLSRNSRNADAQVLADTLNAAIGRYLDERRAPSRNVHERDNRGSHFYLALFWAEELAAQTVSEALQKAFAPVAESLREHEAVIVDELNSVQGGGVDLGGYYLTDPLKADAAMRPSKTFNAIIDAL